MILTSGQLYFINEQDVQTGERTHYYKIGIVRDAAERDSKDRLLEHQTGNPRKLCIVETLSMPAVEAIETNLHYLFARNRVMGEWMIFTDAELQSAIEKAKELAAEMEANVDDFKFSEILKDTKSNGSILAPTEEAHEHYGVIQDLGEVLDICDEVLIKYDMYLHQAIEQGVDVSGRAKVQERAGAKRFDEKLFAATYPEIFKLYATSTFPIKGSFRVKAAKDWDIDLSILDEDQVDLITNFKNELAISDLSMEAGFALHEKHLGILEIRKYAEWKIEIAKMKLRVLTGDSDGIDGICSWKREAKEVITLNKLQLQIDHPEEFNSCIVQGADTKALIVEPKVAPN